MKEFQLPERSRIIAVVDGDPAVRHSLKFALEAEGFTVRACARALEFLEIVNAETIHCTIIDHRLQDMTGLELIDRLRERDFRTPIVLLASHPNAALHKQAERRGISIVEKPLTNNALTERLRELLV